MAIWRVETVKAELGHRSNASIYQRVRDGLFTKPVPIGPRAVGWPDYECKAICNAHIAGRSDEEIKALVNELHARRAKLSTTTAEGALL